MPTFRIADVQPDHVYIVVTEDDGSSYGKMLWNLSADGLAKLEEQIKSQAAQAPPPMEEKQQVDLSVLEKKIGEVVPFVRVAKVSTPEDAFGETLDGDSRS